MELTAGERENILHSLGLNGRGRWSHRNWFFGNDPVCEGMVAKGLMTKKVSGWPEFNGEPHYFVTEEGIKAAGVWSRVRIGDRYMAEWANEGKKNANVGS